MRWVQKNLDFVENTPILETKDKIKKISIFSQAANPTCEKGKPRLNGCFVFTLDPARNKNWSNALCNNSPLFPLATRSCVCIL